MNTKTKFNLQYLRTIIIGIIIIIVIIISTTSAFSGDFSVTKWKELTGYSDPISDVQFSPLGNYFTLISGDTVELYDKNWNKIWEDADSSNFAWALAFSPDEKYIVFRRYKSNILRLSDKQIIQTLGYSDSVGEITFSPDGKYLALGSDDQTVKIWQFSQGQLVEHQTLTGHSDDIKSVAFSSDGNYLASGSDDQTIKIWQLSQGQFVKSQTLTGHSDYVTSVSFSPLGNYLASGSEDQTIKIWQFSGKDFAVQTLTGHSDYVTSVAFSPDGSYLASGSEDNTVKIWHLSTGKFDSQTLTGHSDDVTSVSFSADGSYLASGGEDGVVIIWQLKKEVEVSPTVDTTPPVVEIVSPLVAETVLANVVGFVEDDILVESVTVDGKPVTLGHARDLRLRATKGHKIQFSTTVSLAEGAKSVRIVAVDSSGNETVKTVTITVQPPSTDRTGVAAGEIIPEIDTTSHPVGERWALLIGVDSYDENRQGDFYLPNLQACVKDVKALDAVLRDAERGGFTQITMLVTNDTPDESDDPTDLNILRGLKELVDRTEPNDLVLIYFSGHGWQVEDEAYLLPQNVNVAFPSRTAIRSADLNQMINQMKAEKVVTILDACHSGGIEVHATGGKAGGTQVTLNRQYQEAFKTSSGKVVLHSCDASEKSWELVDGSQGVFSKYLVDGLLGAADAQGNDDGVITFQEAYQYVYEKVVDHMKQDGRGQQRPVRSGKWIGDIPLTINPSRKAAHQIEKQVDQVYVLIADAVVAERAIALLKKHGNQEALTQNEERLLNYLDNLLGGKISLDTYLGADERFGR